jgi:hypothetical protein
MHLAERELGLNVLHYWREMSMLWNWKMVKKKNMLKTLGHSSSKKLTVFLLVMGFHLFSRVNAGHSRVVECVHTDLEAASDKDRLVVGREMMDIQPEKVERLPFEERLALNLVLSSVLCHLEFQVYRAIE